MKLRRISTLGLFVMFGVALTSSAVYGQRGTDTAKDPVAEADEKILAEIHEHNEIMSNLEYLSDVIGARLTGTENLKKANDWIRQKFADYGVANPHLEPWTVAHTWTRVSATGQIVSPSVHTLTIASYAWAPSTNGAVRGHVVYVKARTLDDLTQYKGKLKDAIVISAEPSLIPAPDQPAPDPVDLPYGDSFLLVAPRRPDAEPAYGPDFRKFLQARSAFFKEEGVLATLTDSGKPDGLLNMTGMGGRTYDIAAIPAAFVSSESYGMIWRLLQRGPVEVELNIANSIGDKPTEVYNTVAEIRGSEKPDEIVILGAHLDSWDLGEGTTDNGTGSMIVLEAARALQKLGLRPKRTIRFLLFSGEEQGLVGSRTYVAAHKDELPKISAALIHDTGTGRVVSISLMRNYQDREVMDKVVAPLHSLGLLELTQRWMTGSDHASFEEAGVPGFFCLQEPAQYFQTHHTQADTFDQAREADLVEGAQVMAAWAYNVAQLPDLLPRKPAAVSGATAGN
ncbi:MAG TPA: M20/M25/M40 family metallo-hydrolase [Candidatus Binatus sp.]|jgi:carboxypeptidase Q|nr:M20/M25/M40 family metallo-hydrolase [Candidatus Binatus sp.]